MSKKVLFFFLVLFFGVASIAQKSIDLSMTYPPGSGVSHNFSIYEPTDFNASQANKLIIGFHPFNIGVWNANTWRDTLRSFIDLTGALYVCPDGGNDGRVDDKEDLEFTEALIDSISSWYKIDSKKIFLIGFSVGGKAVYDYAFSHPKQIKGSIPIGAAVENGNYTNSFINGRCEAFYLVHGNKDIPNSRYYPMKTGLELKDALVDGILLANIGHTIAFDKRDAILKTAFNFVDTSDCDFTGLQLNGPGSSGILVYPSTLYSGETVRVESVEKEDFELSVWNTKGQLIHTENNSRGNTVLVNTASWPPGVAYFRIKSKHISVVKRVIIQE